MQKTIIRILVAACSILLTVSLVSAKPKKADRPIVEIKVLPIDPAQAAKVSYIRDIKPLLADRCVECHAQDPESEFEVTSVPALLKGGKKKGPAVIAGKPDESPLVKYLRGEFKPQMPDDEPVLSE